MSHIPILFALFWLLSLPVMGAQTQAPSLAPGYADLDYQLPQVGSYRLPPLGQAADGEVLDTEGKPRRLHEVLGNGYALLAFIYSSCSDANGCPLSNHVFYKMKAQMKRDAELAKRLRLVSLSFDPAVDTPQVMKLFANNFRYAGSAGAWQFITTSGQESLLPLLSAYRQEVLPEHGTSGYAHVLRVFLIDPEQRIRNIYNASFLHHQLVLNDVRTLMAQEQMPQESIAATTIPTPKNRLSLPGDDKRGYRLSSYRTNSRALEMRQGEPADLVDNIEKPPLGLPPVPVPVANPVTAEKVALGRKLFYDRRLSLNDTFSCAMCHVPEQGFSSNELAMAVGIEGRSVRRNTPTIYNTAYATLLFHDGREDTLEQQAWGPLLAANEMGNPSIGYVLNKIRRISDYDGLFQAAFDNQGVSMSTLGMAVASYQRTLVSADSPFDRWYYAKQADALSPTAQRGFILFTGKARCSSCHTVGERSALLTDNGLHNTGVGYRESMGIRPPKELITIAPGVTIEVAREIIERVGEKPPTDIGRYEVTQNPFDRWKYKTPSLRNIALTAPYMHNGSISTLPEVVDFYNAGGIENELLDPLITPLGLSDREKDDLISFLQSLTGSNVDRLVADAFAAPVGDIKKGDPTWVHGTAVEVR